MTLRRAAIFVAKRWHSIVVFAFFATLPLAHTPALRQGLAAIILIYAVYLLLVGGDRVPRSSVLLPLLAWTALYLLSALWSIDPAYTLEAFKNEVVYPFLSFWAFYVVFSLRREQGAGVLGVVASVLILLVVILAAVLPLMNPGENPLLFVERFQFMASNDILEHNSHYFPGVGQASSHLALVAPILWAAIFYRSARWLTLSMTVVLVALCLAGLLTANRMFWITVPVVGIWFWWWRLRTTRSLRIALSGVLAMILLLGVGVYTLQHRTSSANLQTVFENNVRWKLWEYWSSKGLERPWLGAGGGYWMPGKAYAAEAPASLPVNARAHGHNILLNTWLRLGVPGVAIFLWLIVALLAEFWGATRDRRSYIQLLGICGINTVLAMLLKNSTDDFMHFAYAMDFWALAGALLGSIEAERRKSAMDPQEPARALT